MVDIVFKRRKENSRSRRTRERGEHYAMYKAQCDSDRMLARRIDAAFTRLSEGCSNKILTAVTQAPNWRVRPEQQEPAGSICLPEVARYNAGYRKSKTLQRGRYE